MLLPVVGGLALYFALFGGEYSLFEMRELRQQLARETSELTELRAETAVLRARVDSLTHDSAALERIARERYGLIREGERLYRFVEDPDAIDDLP